MPTRNLRVSLASSASAPAQARAALGKWLDGSSCDAERRADLMLVISELVSNVVRHTASRADVFVAFDDGCVRLEVHDEDRGAPIERLAGNGEGPGGLGLRLVRAVTDGWGWHSTPHGKVVWAESLC